MRVWLDGMPRTTVDLINALMASGCSLASARAYVASFSHDPVNWQPHHLQSGPRKGQVIWINPQTNARRDEPPGQHSHGADFAALESAPVMSVYTLNGGRNVSRIVAFEDGTSAVFKPAWGENPDMRVHIKDRYYAREAAASKLAHMLGLGHLVPATVVRVIPTGGGDSGDVGCLQRFVPNAQLGIRAGQGDSFQDVAMAGAFDYLIGNTDRHGGNWLVNGGKLTLIDHGHCFPPAVEPFAVSHLTNEMVAADAPVPPVVRQWAARWPEIERLLVHGGLTTEEVRMTRARLLTMAAAPTFGRLPAYFANGWEP
jgi:hypothetical protein